MKRRAIAALVLAGTAVLATAASGGGAATPAKARQYVVLYEKSVSAKASRSPP
mgnify:CR=1 FL=1